MSLLKWQTLLILCDAYTEIKVISLIDVQLITSTPIMLKKNVYLQIKFYCFVDVVMYWNY